MPQKDTPTYDFLSGGGEMGALMRSFDFSATPLGPASDWPQSLRSAVSICLNSRFPIVLYWGPDLIALYNDAYMPILGSKHPWALGKPFKVAWADIWDVLGPVLQQVQHTGVPSWAEDQLLIMQRSGYPEETYFTFSFGAGRDEQGAVGGIFCAVTETTQRVLHERRLATLKELSADAKTVQEAAEITAKILDHTPDIPFALIYLLDQRNGQASLVSQCGLTDHPAAPQMIDLRRDEQPWPLNAAIHSGEMKVVQDLEQRFGHLPGRPWPQPTTSAVVLPLRKAGQQDSAAILVLGISPGRAFDDAYRHFFELVGTHVATMIANARAYEEERRRAEALAELDRAKTTFFSNVSHELRTPLTLMLDPLEEALKDSVSENAPAHRGRLEFAYRNSRRLLKLVNSLLDFARIEGGRMEATFEPTDLAEMTTDLAGVFRAATEQARLTLNVDCPALSQPVYVDRDMWEKIVLNLLSNAFKFTFEGGIAVTMREESEPEPSVLVRVEDSGTGIPEEQLARIFDRFHRIPGARGRSIEGTGIGLALVKQLVQLHGGTIEVASVVDQGSTFTIRLPLGSAHLPQDQVRGPRYLASTATRADVFVEEALRWLPSESADHAAAAPSAGDGRTSFDAPQGRPTVLVADDNADMRAYVGRLLSRRYQVVIVEDGETALKRILADPPDLVLADVMMPGLDGFGLVQALRGHQQTSTIPVMLLSARAGEESLIEGLERGADDYLIKPFSANELL
ncbi:MAG TPA: ATP-binding protein, partial [Nitrospira sp.]|nr:ATP-binding protein [Nitrospira sp.]